MARVARRGKGSMDPDDEQKDSVGSLLETPSQLLSNVLKTLEFTFEKDIGMLNGPHVKSVPDFRTLSDLKNQLDKLNTVIDDISNNDKELIEKLREIRENKLKDKDTKGPGVMKDTDVDMDKSKDTDVGQDVEIDDSESVEANRKDNDEIEPAEDTAIQQTDTPSEKSEVQAEHGVKRPFTEEEEGEAKEEEQQEETNDKKRHQQESVAQNPTDEIPFPEENLTVPERKNDAHLLEKDKNRMENDPNYKNPNAEFVISQTLPAAASALGLYSEDGTLERTGEAYLKKKYSVASYPLNDLKEYLPGTLPDMDFSCPKPTNQIQFSTFLSSVDNYFRDFTDDDIKFLKTEYILPANLSMDKSYEPQSTPYIIPKLGPLYSTIWLKEDNNQNIGNISPPIIATPDTILPKLGPDDINDSALDSENVSCGPLLSRLLSSILRTEVENDDDEDNNVRKENETNAPSSQQNSATNTDGNISVKIENDATNEEGINNVHVESKSEEVEPPNEELLELTRNLTAVKEGIIPQQPSLNIDNVNIDYPTFEERLKRELKYVGIYMNLPKDENNPTGEDPDWLTGREDDEVSAELRTLQHSLKSVTVKNARRKTQLLPRLERYLAWQEYLSILDDLDKQIDHAYIKRIRAPKKKKKHHHAANPVQSASQIAQQKAANSSLRALLDRRKRWITKIGPLFDSPEIMKRIPKENIFKDINQEDEDEDADVFGQSTGNKEDELPEQ
ncbi:hypothetical protein TPHA_0L00840 [Tetrapisispora phaffii CBS 4417]|uniref:Transcriptional adapter 3 n=1 Tax=Tetrapisispora phaffii (strain ATCC 24235 / CBS 4417 / NBRC 1672 / NRRL Y-8282 / UCD 70-5) TaxID=1071381 RepID=G8BZW3_TETPH|nr:hypothetical protein TPHA_0L00840 [Tetrapisispora phaffii CBS 4417]CCE65441.1 hypothetical protein TPHA_0L00840 [Tetrapisispora phaffii CBS 4417]